MSTSQGLALGLMAALLTISCHREVGDRQVSPHPSRRPNRVDGPVLGPTDWQEHLAWCPPTDTQPERGAPTVIPDDIVGEWFIDQAVPNTGGEWYAFLPDSVYLDMPDVLSCSDRTVARRGTWRYKEKGIEVTELDVVKLRGGSIELEGVDVASTIVGGTPVSIPLNRPRRFRLELVVTKDEAEDGAYRISLQRRDGLRLWKYGSNSDPERAGRYESWSPTLPLPKTADLDADCEPPPG